MADNGHRTQQRRSTAERQLAQKIENLADGKKGDPELFAQGEKMTAAALASHRFEFSRARSSVDTLPIHYFHDVGDSVVGILGESQPEIWKAVTYPLLLDDGRVIRLPGNRRLAKLIQTTHAVGLRVKITYLGKFNKCGLWYEKCYSIKLLPKLKRQQEQEAAEVKPVPLDQAAAQRILEEAADKGNKVAREMLERKKRRAK